jgi:ribose 5-phosphate isomerase A
MTSTTDREKQSAAARSLDYVEDGMVVGLGTGSTAAHMVRALGERVRAGLKVTGVPTSRATAALAGECGIPLTTLEDVASVDLTIDGADEADPGLRLIKGGGGALLREKVVASVSRCYVIVVDQAKRVDRLGAFALPVEVIPFAWKVVSHALATTHCTPTLRRNREGEPFVTDEGHSIIDCAYGEIADPEALAQIIEGMAGVVGHGLFLDMADVLIVGRGDDTEVIERGG